MKMHYFLRGLCAAMLVACTLPAAAQARPAAPFLTVGAENIKQLRFDWEDVAGANYFQLWYKPGADAAWMHLKEIAGHRNSTRLNVAIHLIDWQGARYRLAACNAAGCRDSDPVSVSTVLPDAVGYFKKMPRHHADGFPAKVRLSADGGTLVAAADNDTQSSASGTASLYVYRKVSGQWQFDTKLVPGLAQAGSGHRLEVTINGDGTVIALGTPSEDLPGTDPEELGDIGAVYVYRRGASGWAQEQKLQILPPRNGEFFGKEVQLDKAGDTLAIWRATGGEPLSSGSIEIYEHSAGGWTRAALIPTLRGQGEDCDAFGLSGNGRRIVRFCHRGFSEHDVADISVFEAPDWRLTATFAVSSRDSLETEDLVTSRKGDTFAYKSWVGERPYVTIYKLTASGWTLSGNVTHGDWTPDPAFPEPSKFGDAIALSADGLRLAVGDWSDAGNALGVVRPPLQTGAMGFGAVSIFERSADNWTLTRVVKPHIAQRTGVGALGRTLSFAQNGRTLAVGAADNGGAEGVGGDPADRTAPNGGAVWLY